MALTRKLLTGMGLTSEQVDTIIDAHTEVVDGLKEQVSTYKADAEQLPEIKKQLEAANSELEGAKKDSWKTKYDLLKQEYDAYKQAQENAKTHEAKEEAYKGLLREAGISEKHLAAVLKVSAVDDVELTDDGKIKDSNTLLKSVKEEWADFIPTTGTNGANTPTPPANTGGTPKTREEILNIKNPAERQKAIGENLDLFQNKGE